MAFSPLKLGENYADALVIDNSVMMRWLFDDGSATDQRYARKVLGHIEEHSTQVLVPYLWVYEAAFVVDFYARQEKTDYENCMHSLNSLFDVVSVVATKDTPGTLFEFAHTRTLSAYDAAYLMLANTHGCAVATLDKKMRKVARKLGQSVFL